MAILFVKVAAKQQRAGTLRSKHAIRCACPTFVVPLYVAATDFKLLEVGMFIHMLAKACSQHIFELVSAMPVPHIAFMHGMLADFTVKFQLAQFAVRFVTEASLVVQ